MRRNAFITAVLALALLSPGHVSLAASHKTHRSAARKATVAPAKHEAAKTTPTKRVSTRKAKSAPATAPAKAVPVSARSPHSRQKTAAAPAVERTSTRSGRRRKATRSDFLQAAGVSDRSEKLHQATQHGTKLAAARASDLAGAAKPGITAPASVTQAANVTPRLGTIEDEASMPVILPTLYNKRGRLIVPPPMRGSHEILVRQNVVADRDGLDRIQDDNDLERMRTARLLVGIPVSSALTVDDRLPVNRRYARPWTAQFLVTLSRAHYARFHTPLQVNSAVRTVEFQQHLQHINGNAAPAEGETASPHLTGQAVDLAKHGLSITEIAWLRGYLLPLSQEGRIDVEEEFQQSCFHISVYKKYMHNGTKREIAAGRHGGASALATGLN
ncbi:MAG: DUF5715 family protein [Edaphobacter sp.]|uniref:DUF5715 family protein n=1 Tax=Edaphobacter sp. TaxID=1934404 RepID=UPI00238C0D29|nr:DUF5715 family protein [Edaphobacter sp.]MDE1177040.1 DUF5715 family protein [Edaphobacter sp.]